MISKEPQPDRLDDLGVDRVDLAARLLALTQASPDPGGLIERAASRLAARASGPRPGEAVIAMISALIEVGAEIGEATTRERTASLRFVGLLAAGLGETERSALRGLLRRGELERPLSPAAQRQIRRLCRGGPVSDDGSIAFEGLAAAAWEALLELLARALAFEPEAELRIDLALLEVSDEVRRAGVRAAIERGQQTPTQAPRAAPGRPSPRPDETMAVGDAPDWPPPERAPLASGHKIGRFTLLTRLGVGAMGVVYSAYDPELDRKIAVKLLRAPEGKRSGRAQARLIREAQAMARLNHPNVAVVHDVGTADRDVFVAMEFIRGRTLQEWRAQRPRGWREIVDAYVQAGRGLAAAHAVGLVHRDFKPSNAMIGDDGRVRVLDFGLCHAEASADASDPSVSDSITLPPVRMTQAEEMVGTPAYMAPEQFHGGAIGAASDQFSFCAALYEALYEQLPFAGDSVFQLAHAVARNELRPAPRGSGVPVWVHAALVRGMRPDPRTRFADMDALLRALDRGRARFRGGALAAGLAVVVAGGLGFWSASARSPAADPCSGGAAEIEGVWNQARRDAGARAFAAAGPALAADIWPRVVEGLDDYADRWQAMHRASCEAHRRGEHSSELLDRRMACLGQRRGALAEAARVLGEADHEVALRALAVVGDLPDIDHCGDIAGLESDAPPPADMKIRAGVEEQRPRLARVRTLARAGRQAAAIELADAVLVVAERLGDRALLAETLLQRSYLAIHSGPEPEQDARLSRAFLTAHGGGLDELAAEALALRLYLRGRSEKGGERALDDLAMAQQTIARMTLRGAAPGRVRGLVLNNAGTMHMALGNAMQAERSFRDALVAREAALGVDHVEVAYTLVNLAMVSGAPDERVRLWQRALGIFDEQLGAAHPETIEVRMAASLHVADPAAARALLAPGCAALDRFADEDHEARARCLGQLAHNADEAGDPAALGMWLTVDELLRTTPSLRMNEADAVQLRGRAALATRAHAEAIADLQAALARPRGDEWWQQRHRAELHLLLAQHLQQLGRVDLARASLRAAVTGYAAASAAASDVLQQRRVALARLLLGASLQGGDAAQRREAAALLEAAERWYRAAGPGYAWRLTQIEGVRREAPAP